MTPTPPFRIVVRAPPPPKLGVGTRVRIIDGAFSGRLGVVTFVTATGKRAVRLDELSSSISLSLTLYRHPEDLEVLEMQHG
jgi:transcription antitermination factor NusG